MKYLKARRAIPRFIALVASIGSVLVLAASACGPKAPPSSVPKPPAVAPPAAQAPTATPAERPAPAVLAAPPAAGARPAPAPPLTGMTTREAVESFNDQWKGLRAEAYTPDQAEVATIRAASREVTVFIVLGTWCPDTRRDLPRFFKIADQAGWPASRMTLLAVNRTKTDPGGETVKWNVTRVPTFIFLRDGKEIGRVTERPVTTLEQDIARIVGKS